jgi:uncharacterized protein YtpQ (UPF0354 family)
MISRYHQLLLLTACISCTRSGPLSSAGFTEACVASLRQAEPGATVVVENDLELLLISERGDTAALFLNNAYATYLQEPAALDELIHNYSLGWIESVDPGIDSVDRSMIVPVVKDRLWMEDMEQSLLSKGKKDPPDYIYEDLNDELVIVYAQDSPTSISYLTPDQLEASGIQRSELRVLACANLKRLLPPIERSGKDGFYLYTAGGSYETSLLLLDSIWQADAPSVHGHPVVAIPSRDLLFLTGSEDARGLERMKHWVSESSAEAVYPISQDLFVLRNGHFERFVETRER